MKRTLTVLISGLCIITALLVFLWLYARHNVAAIEQQGSAGRVYDAHYVLISDERSDQWRSIYEAARETAQETGVSLEWLGESLPAEYDSRDCIRIATAAKADGIILHMGSSRQVTDLIDIAAGQGIPVVTVLTDDADSARVSSIGLNSYQTGEIYGTQILKNLKEGKNEILVLQNTSLDNSASALLYQQMVQTAEQGKGPGQEVSFSVMEINTLTSFDAEEDIRDIFLSGEAMPDILICLDLTSTECACQALVDYNRVGSVTVIGYYASEKVIDSLKKGLLESTLYLDAQEIGSKCIEALNEYRELGHVNNYYNVALRMIDGKTVGQIS